jgi:hypothetical protein
VSRLAGATRRLERPVCWPRNLHHQSAVRCLSV